MMDYEIFVAGSMVLQSGAMHPNHPTVDVGHPSPPYHRRRARNRPAFPSPPREDRLAISSGTGWRDELDAVRSDDRLRPPARWNRMAFV